MRKAGVANFEAFARDILEAIPDRPISFEVFSDDFARCAARRALSRRGVRTRELLNIVQADAAGAHIITVTNDLLAKLPPLGKDLTQFSLETVQMFHRDATAAGYQL